MRKVSLFFLSSILSISLSAQEVLKQADFGIQKDSVIGYVKSWRGPEFIESSKEYWSWGDWQKADSRLHLIWDHAKENWKPNRNIHFSYHSGHGKKTASFSHTWDKATARWWKTQRDTTIYLDSGKKQEVYTHKLTMGSSIWKNDRKNVYTYTSDNSYTVHSYNWDFAEKSWKAYSKTEIGESASGQIEYFRYYRWHALFSDWDLKSRASYAYDEEGRLVEEIKEEEDNLLSTRYISSYNEWGYLEELIEYTSYPPAGKWVESSRISFRYDLSAKLFREDIAYKDPTTDSWVLNHYFQIYGKTHREALQEEVESVPLSCNFPNPYTANTPFNCTEMLSGKEYQLELLDLAGRRVEVQKLIGDEIISLKAQVPQGIYLLLIKDQSQVLTAEKIYVR